MTRSGSASEAEWLREVAWLLGQWHTSRNEPLDPKLLRAGSNRRVWWRCPAGHEWQTTIAGRARRGTRCPYCIGQRASASNNLAVTAPEVAATWHPTRNETLTPATVLPKSGRAVWWLCPAGHEWRTSVYARVSHRSGCPYCARQRATDETSLVQRYPTVAAEWHPTRNGNRTPETTTFGSRIGVFWVCSSCGYEWRATPHSRTVRGTGCRECAWSTTRISHVPLTVTHPEIAAQWHPTRNEEATPDQITYGSGRRVWWQCSRGHSWRTTVNARTTPPGRQASGNERATAPTGSGCPYCAGTRATTEHNLAAARPDLACEWHPDRNADRRPAQVTPRSNQRVWWQCGTCGHTWAATVKSRVVAGTGCPSCARIAGGRPVRSVQRGR